MKASEAKRLSPQAKADIQGFITSAFGHLPFSAYLSVEFRDPVWGRLWLKQLLPYVSTAASWRLRADQPKVRPMRTLNIALTWDGLKALGLSEAGLRAFPPEFRQGMAAPERGRILGDSGESAAEQWEFGGPNNETVHALLILNAQTTADLEAWCGVQREMIQGTQGGVVEHEKVAQFGARPDHGHEPFGFFDGIAQPQIEGIKGEGVHTGEFILGYPNEYGFYPVSPVTPAADDPKRILPLSANPFHKADRYRDLGFNGSYLVYRKLEQDVTSLWRFLQSESLRVKGRVEAEFMVWLGAKMVGRWPSGTPLVLAPDGDQDGLRTDDFLYAREDPQGLACPFGAHIRRTNPRDQIGATGPLESQHMSARHRILRRGKPYGPDLFDPTLLTQVETLQAIVDLADDGQQRGVHFLCVNASIKDQFEFIQQTWVNNPSFSGLVKNPDPLVGKADSEADPGVMLVPGTQETLHTETLPRLITVRGGLYGFMPSLTALRYLSEIM